MVTCNSGAHAMEVLQYLSPPLIPFILKIVLGQERMGDLPLLNIQASPLLYQVAATNTATPNATNKVAVRIKIANTGALSTLTFCFVSLMLCTAMSSAKQKILFVLAMNSE
jgi:hypothetical protein